MKVCPLCSEWRYRQLVKICPLCLAPGGLHEVEDLAGDFIRQFEAARLEQYCRAFDATENRRLETAGYWKSIRGRSLESFGFAEV